MQHLSNIEEKREFAQYESVKSAPGVRINEDCLNSIRAILRKPGDINRLFFRLTDKLNRLYSITKAALIVHSNHDNKLKTIAMKGINGTCEGLALTLPENDSLLYRVFTDGFLYIQNYPDPFSGNFFEEKMLVDQATQSLAVLPITEKNSPTGLICFSSTIPNAFESFEDGILDDILENFGHELKDRLPSIKY